MAEVKAIGNLTADAQLRYTASGTPVLNFRIGDSKSKKDGDEWKTVAQNWFNVTVWGSLAEHLGDKLSKGVRVEVIGEMYMREYDRQDGTKGTSMDLNAWGVRVITPPKNRSAGATDAANTYNPAAQQQQAGWGNQQQGPPQQQGGWGNQPPQNQQGGGWNAPPANDPWSQGQQGPPQGNTNQQGGWHGANDEPPF